MTSCVSRESALQSSTPSSAHRCMHFLLVEDDDDHAHLVLHHLRRSDPRNRVDHVRDGQQAMDFLRRQGSYSESARPDLILLDLNLPKLNGHEVLNQVKQDPELRSIPVVVLTTSAADADRQLAYRAFANSYLVKPVDFQEFRDLVEMLSRYWRDWNQPCHRPF